MPFRVTVLGALATNPPVYVWVPPDCPKVRVPVLLKVTALVMVLAVPVKAALLTVLATVKLAGLTAPLKLAVPPIVCRAKVPKPLTVVPVTSAVEVPAPVPVCRVKVLLPKVTAPKVRSPAVVVALVFRVVFSAKVIAPKTMAVLVVLIVPLRVLIEGLVAPAAFRPPV